MCALRTLTQMNQGELLDPDDPTFVTALARGLAVIRAFDQDHSRMTLSEVAARTDLTRATARRCLLTLRSLGYVDCAGKQFYITPNVLRLGYAYIHATPLPRLVQPFLEEISERTGESSSAAVLNGDDILYVARSATKRIMAVGLGVGTSLPAYCTSMGRVLLAALGDGTVRAFLRRVELKPFTSHTITDAEQLRRILSEVRNQGWAMVDQELEDGLWSIAAPIRDSTGRVIAAMNIGAQAARVATADTQSALRRILLECAAKLSPHL